jgi:hypothetical protein
MSSGDYWGHIEHFEGNICQFTGHVKMVRWGSEELTR